MGNTKGRRGVAAAQGGGGSTARAAAGAAGRGFLEWTIGRVLVSGCVVLQASLIRTLILLPTLLDSFSVSAKEDSLSWLAPAPGAIYMPANGTRRRGASQPRSARPARDRQLVPVPPPLPLTSRLHHSGSGGAGGHEGGGRVGGQSADGGMPTRRRDDTMRASAGVWRPSGKQPIPDALPSPGRSSYRAKAEGEASRETQEVRRSCGSWIGGDCEHGLVGSRQTRTHLLPLNPPYRWASVSLCL